MIYVECKPDVALVESITEVSKDEIIHSGNKASVCKDLEEQRNCVGMVDEDPRSIQPYYIRRVVIPKDDLPQYGLRTAYDNNSNYLIILRPKLEEWVLKNAEEAGIDVTEYGLPNYAKGLHRIINRRLDEFKRLVADLRGQGRMKVLERLFKSKNE